MEARFWKIGSVVFGGMLILALAVYWPVLNNTLVADDFFYVALGSTPVSNLLHLFWVQPNFSVRPLAMFTFWTQNRLFGESAWASHLINVSFHVGTAFILTWFLVRMGARRTTAVLAGLLFLLTPMAPEAVTWSSGRFDQMALFFMVLALALYGVCLTRNSRAAFAGSMAAVTAAFLCKESAMVLVVMVPLMEILFSEPSRQKVILADAGAGAETFMARLSLRLRQMLSDRGFLWRMGIFLTIFIGDIVLHFAILGKLGGYPNVPLFGEPIVDSVKATLQVIVAPLSNLEASHGIILALGLYTLLLCLAGLVLVILRWRQATVTARRLIVLFAVFFFVSLAPVYTQLFIIGVDNTLKESRELYTPTLCLLAVLVIALSEFSGPRRVWKGAALAALLVLVPVYATSLYVNNLPWQRASAITYSIPRQTVELVPDPPEGAKFTFTRVPEWQGGYIFITGLPQAIKNAYGRDDISVTRVRVAGPQPDANSEGYIFDYEPSSGLLSLVKRP